MGQFAERVRELIARHPRVRAVTFVGSRARGEATAFSDWDFTIETDDFAAVTAALPGLTEPLKPLAALWDLLANEATYMLIIPGPAKVDFIFDQPWTPLPPYSVNGDTLPAIDAHFWDWSLWLTSKVAAGKAELVERELRKMKEYLLEPMGVTQTPRDLVSAVDAYLAARTRQEARWGLRVSRELGAEVAGVVRQQASGLP